MLEHRVDEGHHATQLPSGKLHDEHLEAVGAAERQVAALDEALRLHVTRHVRSRRLQFRERVLRAIDGIHLWIYVYYTDIK